jgi:hypothetical protein
LKEENSAQVTKLLAPNHTEQGSQHNSSEANAEKDAGLGAW